MSVNNLKVGDYVVFDRDSGAIREGAIRRVAALREQGGQTFVKVDEDPGWHTAVTRVNGPLVNAPARAAGGCGERCKCADNPPSEQHFDERDDEIAGYDVVATPLYDPIKRPYHYNQGTIEPLDFIEAHSLGFCAGNVIKYVTRYRYSDNPLVDLRKAQRYLERLIQQREDASGSPD